MAKIMLVEDDNNLSEIYQARMMAEGYTVVAAHDGEEALALAAKEKPDLIISDVMMPKISGFEMLDILRNTQGLKDTKVIMLTALGQAEDKTRADSLGANRYLVKSQVTLEDIVKAAQELLTGADVSTSTTTPAPTAPSPVTSTPVAPAPVATPPATPAPPTPQPAETQVQGAVTQSTAQEQTAIQNQIANFEQQPQAAPVVPPPSPAATDDKLVTDAVNDLMSSASPQTSASAPSPVTSTPVAPAPVATPSAPAPTEPTSTPTNGDNNASTRKKVISPITDDSSRPDLNSLLAAEEAKSGQTTIPHVETPLQQPTVNTQTQPGNILMPTQPQDPDAANNTGIDPNSIAL